MKYAIVYSSQTGNTKLLAETIKIILSDEDCIYFGNPDTAALEADRIYVGFWTDKGTCDKQSKEFLKNLNEKEVYLFGTAGFGISQAYFDKIIERTAENLNENVKLIGHFMCQGKMPMSVRKRYEKMLNSETKVPNIQGMIDNFDKALSHPDKKDLDNLKNSIYLCQE